MQKILTQNSKYWARNALLVKKKTPTVELKIALRPFVFSNLFFLFRIHVSRTAPYACTRVSQSLFSTEIKICLCLNHVISNHSKWFYFFFPHDLSQVLPAVYLKAKAGGCLSLLSSIKYSNEKWCYLLFKCIFKGRRGSRKLGSLIDKNVPCIFLPSTTFLISHPPLLYFFFKKKCDLLAERKVSLRLTKVFYATPMEMATTAKQQNHQKPPAKIRVWNCW